MSLGTRLSGVVVGLAALVALSGCEAPLNLERLIQEKSKPVLRFDQFQSITNTGQVVVTVGSAGVVLNSKDGGATWQRQELAGAPSLIDVTYCPDRTLVALDIRRNLWLSQDDGDSWQARPIATTETPLALTCDPRNGLWVVGSFSTILATVDRGETWQAQSLDEDLMLTTVQFVEPGFAVITGEFGTVLTSEDEGVTWERAGELPSEFYPLAALFTSRSDGYISGLNGQILHSADGGQSWARQQTVTESPLYGLAVQDGQLYAAGDFGILLRQQGERWVRQEHDLPAFSYLRGVAPINHRDLMLAGGMGALFRLPSEGQAENYAGQTLGLRP